MFIFVRSAAACWVYLIVRDFGWDNSKRRKIMDRHLTAVAALQIGTSILGLFIIIFVGSVLAGASTFVDDPEAMLIMSIVFPAIGVFFSVLCVLGIIGGIGLFVRHSWARILVLILSAIDLFNVPIGTALGIYSIWVLVQQETVELFQR
jgi:O-antigen/teichoic acid export membrane protein